MSRPREPDRPVGRLEQAQQRPGEGRLAAAGLADQPQRLALGELEAHVVDGVHAGHLALDR